MWIIITITGSVCLAIWFLWENFGWKCTLRMLANSYIDAREKDNLSAKEAFLKALATRFQLKKTTELMKELEDRGVSDENQIKQETKKLLWRNTWRQNVEYRYGAILARKGFFKEATDLKFSRSPIEGFICVGDDVEQKMWREEWGVEDDNNYGLLELLICGLIIENYKVHKRNYNGLIAKMIENYFKGQNNIDKYLNEAQTIIKKEVNPKKILDEYMSKREDLKVVDQKMKALAGLIVSNAKIKQEQKAAREIVCPRCGHKNPPGVFRCKNEECLDILPQND